MPGQLRFDRPDHRDDDSDYASFGRALLPHRGDSRFSDHSMSSPPRIGPGGLRDIGLVNVAIARVIGLAAGGPPPDLFTTLSRHRRLFRRWLRFAGPLMLGGALPRADTELLILRTAHNCRCAYEWEFHERLGREAGLSAQEIAEVRNGPNSETLGAEQRLLLAAADELHDTRCLSDELWSPLRARYTDPQLIELCMLVGHYEMLAMTINSLQIVPDPPPMEPARAIGHVRRVLARRHR